MNLLSDDAKPVEGVFRRVPELQRFTRLTILGGLRCARLHLWDEDEGRLVGSRHLRALPAGA